MRLALTSGKAWLSAAIALTLLSPALAPAQFIDAPPCTTPPAPPAIDPHRSLWVHDVATFTAPGVNFSLRRTLNQLAAQAVAGGAAGTTAISIFRELWDTQNTAPGLGLGAHCDDFTTAGIPGFTLNDYPLSCRPSEGVQATGGGGITPDQYLDNYIAIGLVNRMDLVDADYTSCGEFRIVYAKRPGFGPGRNFIIFEAVLPNPFPGCKSGCRPVADFWAALTTTPLPNRAVLLQNFFYNGLAGFAPVVHIDHYGFGGGSADGGQIRTNQFMIGPWLLKEFKLALVTSGAGVVFDVVPVTVKVNPYGELFNSALPGGSPYFTRGLGFQTDFTGQLGTLGINDINGYFYNPNDLFNWGESDAQGLFTHQYAAQTNLPGFPTPFMNTLDTFAPPLTRDHFANRALTLSCGGCHEPIAYGLNTPGSIADPAAPIAAPVSAFAPTGLTDRWPLSLGFVHARETPVGAPPGIFPLSQALLDVFLPAREVFFANYRANDICDCIIPPPVTAGPPPASAFAAEAERADAPTADAPLPLDFGTAADAAGDADFERLLIRAEVQAMDAAEPPRLTASGVVRTH